MAVACLVVSAAQGAGVPDKRTRTPAQHKLDSQLLLAIHGDPAAAVQLDAAHRVLADIRVDVTSRTEALVRQYKGRVVSTSVQYRSIVAWVPLTRVEALAADARITAISPAPRALPNRRRQK